MKFYAACEIAKLLERRTMLLGDLRKAPVWPSAPFSDAVDAGKFYTDVSPYIVAAVFKQIKEVDAALVERGVELDGAE